MAKALACKSLKWKRPTDDGKIVMFKTTKPPQSIVIPQTTGGIEYAARDWHGACDAFLGMPAIGPRKSGG